MFKSIKEKIIQQCLRYNTECEMQDYHLSNWPENWPYCGCAGVYLVINNDNEVIYVGEAKNIGNRLSQHFIGGANNSAICKEEWVNPNYIIVVKMPDDRKAFRKTLEEELYYIYLPTGKLYNKKM